MNGYRLWLVMVAGEIGAGIARRWPVLTLDIDHMHHDGTRHPTAVYDKLIVSRIVVMNSNRLPLLTVAFVQGNETAENARIFY